MSRWAIISDIHANAAALDAVIKAAQELDVDGWMCAGDVVGYGPDPEYCISELIELNAVVVRGNHEDMMVSEQRAAGVRNVARDVIEWQRRQLWDSQLNWIRSLPLQYEVDNIFIRHEGDPNGFSWPLTAQTAFAYAIHSIKPICIFGHTHVEALAIGRVGGFWRRHQHWTVLDRLHTGVRLKVDTNQRHLLTLGSVGQPRAGNLDAAFATFDSKLNILEFHRTPYDVEKTCQRLSNVPHGDRLAAILRGDRQSSY